MLGRWTCLAYYLFCLLVRNFCDDPYPLPRNLPFLSLSLSHRPSVSSLFMPCLWDYITRSNLTSLLRSSGSNDSSSHLVASIRTDLVPVRRLSPSFFFVSTFSFLFVTSYCNSCRVFFVSRPSFLPTPRYVEIAVAIGCHHDR